MPLARMALRLRLVPTIASAVGMTLVILMVGALFPAVGDSIGKLDLPKGVATLLGGADYGTMTGWMRSEIGAVYGPLVVAYIAISAAVSSTAGEEESGVLALILSQPVRRSQLVLAKAGATAAGVSIVALGTFVGLVAGVAVGGGGISPAKLVALTVHLAFFGWALGACALALAAGTGRRSLAAGAAAGLAVVGFLLNGLAPLVDAIAWLRYVSLFHYYEGHDPIGNGIDASDLLVLAVVAAASTAVAVVGLGRRDLRG